MTGYMDRIDLTAHGFFTLDGARCGYDFTVAKPNNVSPDLPENSWKGQPFNYFTQGVAYAEVEVDLLSGNHRTIRSDVIVDVGSSINPALDIGQIEGAFIQGMGWSTIEEVIYADDDHTWVRPRGKLFTTGPGTYKIPGKFPLGTDLAIHFHSILNIFSLLNMVEQLSTMSRKLSMSAFWKT